MDKEIAQALLDTLIKIKEWSLNMQKKREAKLWEAIPVPLRLADALSRLTKEELAKIRQNLGLKKLSHLNKQELIVRLNELLPENIGQAFRYFDENRYRLFRPMIDNGGYVSQPKVGIEQIEYLQNHGLAFSGSVDGRKVLAVPQEIAAAFRKADDADLRSLVERNTKWIKLTQGMLYCYGVLDLHQAKKMIQTYTGEIAKPDHAEVENYAAFMMVIHDASAYYGEIRIKWRKKGTSGEAGRRLLPFHHGAAASRRRTGICGPASRLSGVRSLHPGKLRDQQEKGRPDR
ncbi:hypothetical protein BSNK01_30810 [Bacillaceae bacterium]